jgi:aspartate-semialdehyde dehydrogenase
VTAVAIVNPSDLVGKELRETLERRLKSGKLPWGEIRLLTTREDEENALTELAGGAALVSRYDAEALDGVDLAFFCGAAAEIAAALAVVPPETTAIAIAPPAVGSPPAEGRLAEARPVVAGVNLAAARAEAHGRDRIPPSPHPAVILLAHLLHPLAALGIEEAVATVVQPASAEGDAGLDELFEQTRDILAMAQRRPTPVFGAQLAFNLLPVPAPAGDLAATLAAVLPEAAGARPLSFRLLQGGVFHSLAASLFVRLAGEPDVKRVRKAVSASPALELVKKPGHLGPIDAAASESVLVGAVQEDPAGQGAFWLWAVMDNLTRGGALNAIEIADAVL